MSSYDPHTSDHNRLALASFQRSFKQRKELVSNALQHIQQSKAASQRLATLIDGELGKEPAELTLAQEEWEREAEETLELFASEDVKQLRSARKQAKRLNKQADALGARAHSLTGRTDQLVQANRHLLPAESTQVQAEIAAARALLRQAEREQSEPRDEYQCKGMEKKDLARMEELLRPSLEEAEAARESLSKWLDELTPLPLQEQLTRLVTQLPALSTRLQESWRELISAGYRVEGQLLDEYLEKVRVSYYSLIRGSETEDVLREADRVWLRATRARYPTGEYGDDPSMAEQIERLAKAEASLLELLLQEA